MSFWNWFGPPSRDRFAKLILKAIGRTGLSPGPSLVYDRDEFRLIGEGRVINLTNLYAEHLKLPRKERAKQIATIASFGRFELPNIPSDFEEARSQLRPKLWARQTLEVMAMEAEAAGKDESDKLPISIPIGEHLSLSLAFDLPDSVCFVTADQLKTWNVTIYEAMEIATENLEEIPMSCLAMGPEKEPIAYSIICGDTYDATRLVARQKIAQLKVDGDPIAIVPNRDALLIAGSDSRHGLNVLLEMSQSLSSEPRPLLPTPLRWTGEEWVDWLPDPDHPLYDNFRELQSAFHTNLYIETQEILQKVLMARDDDIFVAKVMSLQLKSDGSHRTFCVWSDGIDSLLPETDLIAFMKEQQAILAPWDEVRNLVGPMLEQDNSYPRRFRTRDFPNEQQFQTIRVMAVE